MSQDQPKSEKRSTGDGDQARRGPVRGLWRWVNRKWWRRLAALFVVGFPIFTIASVEVTSTPSFCSSCHIMEPYYESWQLSAHKDVSCVKCHISPGATSYVDAKLNGLGQVVDDALNRTSTKPSASINQLSCLRSGCHSVEQLSGKTIDNGTFRFRHDKHVGRSHLGIEFTCGTCHSHVKGESHFEVNTDVCVTCHMLEGPNGHAQGLEAEIHQISLRVRGVKTSGESEETESGHKWPPNACVTCHEPPRETLKRGSLTIDHSEYLSYGASCESCHHGATATPPPIADGACLACHTYGIERAMPAEEMHKVHTEGLHKIECFSCHGMIDHGPEAQIMSIARFDCQRCHINEHSLQQMAYQSNGIDNGHGDVSEADQTVNPMFMAHVDCSGCHVTETSLHNGATVIRASAQACDNCHQTGMGEQTIALWQDSTRTRYAEVSELAEQVGSMATTDATRRLLAEAVELLGIVEGDGSWGVHNPTYTQSLLERAREKLVAVRDGAGGAP